MREILKTKFDLNLPFIKGIFIERSITQGRRENSEAPGQKKKTRPPASRNLSGSRK